MKIEILGGGCKTCQDLYKNTEEAVKELGLEAVEMGKVTDMQKIVSMGVLMTPGIAVDGKVVASGRLFTVKEIVALLKK